MLDIITQMLMSLNLCVI